MPLNDYAILALGVLLAGAGGELFVRGAVGLARWARVSPGIIGATVAAFATSSPELSVSLNAALAGQPQIALGDALGSNIVNVALVLAIALLIAEIHSPRQAVRRDFPVAAMVPVATAALFADGVLTRLDGLVLLALFCGWLGMTVNEARRQRSAAPQVLGERKGWIAMLLCGAGLALLVAGGDAVVAGARAIARSFGIGEFVIGATVVAVGTSAPELATAIVARLRGHDEIGLGTILGSNIFNGLFIVAVAAIITPIRVDRGAVAVALGFGLLAVAATFPARDGRIGRGRGALLLAIYAAYLAAVLAPEAG